MRRLAKNLILATAVVSAIFLVDLSPAGATPLDSPCTIKKICPLGTDEIKHLDFWGKFRDTVMPDPNKPQNNNPPKEMPKPRHAEKPRHAGKPKPVEKPRHAPPPKPAN